MAALAASKSQVLDNPAMPDVSSFISFGSGGSCAAHAENRRQQHIEQLYARQLPSDFEVRHSLTEHTQRQRIQGLVE